MARTRVWSGVTLLCCFLPIVLSQSDLIRDPAVSEVILPDRMVILEHVKLVLGAIQRLDSRVGNLGKRLEAQDTKLAGIERVVGTMEQKLDSMDSNIEALDSKTVTEKLSHVEIKLEDLLDTKVSGKLDVIEAKLIFVSSEIVAMSNKLENIETKVVSTEAILNRTEESLRRNNDMEEPLLPLKPNELGDSNEQEKQTLIGKILNGTRGRLYTQLNHRGQFYDYDLGNLTKFTDEGCIQLPRYDFKSVETYNGCVRIFSDTSGCNGLSLAVYPGSDNFPNIRNSNFTENMSLGPCLPNEFEFSRLSNDTNGIVVNKNGTRSDEIPDQAVIGGHWEYDFKSTAVDSPTNPVRNYLLNTNNRIIYFHALVNKRHLTQAAPACQMKSSAAWKLFDKKEGDDLGFVIPPSMGGPGSEIYNIFSQSRINAVEWNKVLSLVARFVLEENSSNYFILYVNFAYPNESTNRPLGFYYQADIGRPNMKTKIIYGFVKN